MVTDFGYPGDSNMDINYSLRSKATINQRTGKPYFRRL